MDLDAFTTVHTPAWERLAALVRRRRLDGAEADELVRLYQEVATHLSTIRSAAPDPVLVTRLSDLLTRARARVGGAHDPAWYDVVRYAAWTVPAALYRVRWWTLGVVVAFLAVSIVAGAHVATDPDALAAMGTPAEREQYVNEAFAAYYDPGASFAAMVWTNNAWIAAQSVALGITGIGPVYVLAQNALSVGAIGGMMAAYGELDTFLQLIAPHGQLEVTAVLVAGAAGLKTFWAMIDPGPRKRATALAQEGRALVTCAVGLAGALALSGLIEGFVTGSALPWWLKIAIGTVALAAFWAYVLVWGSRAVAAGQTGDLDTDRAGAVAPTAG
ncbi:stage II sporulation protein M [Xylanimonas ulmi]|uniref:Putative membrane protein SpoIIM required for sporulation n=1 Tax=Xylanimonas ulmi TaxID=228973 RepID=A0A4V2EXM4_9MICO|nr:stage II sporulation protein M [Xylanibacterium ulmi]RZS60000.1 putative membrane protein SpoIIM required for sporulation [Xylanibacterium ulmi]